MKIEYHQYQLTAKNPINSKQSHSLRHGALLRVTFPDGRIGYCDCHPWAEIGDATLDQQLSTLKNKQFTPLTKQSLACAKLDAEARNHRISLFDGLTIPKSHFLISNVLFWNPKDIQWAINNGFDRFKVKLGQNLPAELPQLKELIALLPSDFKVRLDFNHKLNQASFHQFLVDLGNAKESIDFFEDPFPFEVNIWGAIQKQWGINLASDLGNEKAIGQQQSAKVIVIKPAIQCMPEIKNTLGQKIVVTSYLDHPIGQLHAAYIAAKNNEKQAGLVSHVAYEPNIFSEQLKIQNAKLIPPQGTGLGFDDLLEAISWREL